MEIKEPGSETGIICSLWCDLYVCVASFLLFIKYDSILSFVNLGKFEGVVAFNVFVHFLPPKLLKSCQTFGHIIFCSLTT